LLTEKYNIVKASLLLAVLGGLIIPFYEHLAIAAEWWSYKDTPTIFNVPYYVIMAEGLLMITVPKLFSLCKSVKVSLIPVLGIVQGLIMWGCCLIAYGLVGK